MIQLAAYEDSCSLGYVANREVLGKLGNRAKSAPCGSEMRLMLVTVSEGACQE